MIGIHTEMPLPDTIAIRKAKRQSWRKYCQGIDQIPSGARLMKVLKSEARNKIGTLKRADDSLTMTGQETLKVLLQTRFPDSKEVDNCPEEWGNQTWNPTGRIGTCSNRQ